VVQSKSNDKGGFRVLSSFFIPAFHNFFRFFGSSIVVFPVHDYYCVYYDFHFRAVWLGAWPGQRPLCIFHMHEYKKVEFIYIFFPVPVSGFFYNNDTRATLFVAPFPHPHPHPLPLPKSTHSTGTILMQILVSVSICISLLCFSYVFRNNS